MENKVAVVLLSGGLDSATVLALATNAGYSCHAITFRYGQRHQQELQHARRVAEQFGVMEHLVVDVDLGSLGGSALTSDIAVPKHQGVDEIGDSIPVTYVPARNTIFLSYGLAVAEARGASHVFIGVNAVDYSGYPDCRPEYIEAFQQLAQLATKQAVEGSGCVTIAAPLISMTKAEIIARGLSLGVDYSLTTSCYDPGTSGVSCGSCDACLLRLDGFAQNSMVDPIEYSGESGS